MVSVFSIFLALKPENNSWVLTTVYLHKIHYKNRNCLNFNNFYLLIFELVLKIAKRGIKQITTLSLLTLAESISFFSKIALPHPPKTSQNVPMNSAIHRLVSDTFFSHLIKDCMIGDYHTISVFGRSYKNRNFQTG